MRVVIVFLCLALAACAGTGGALNTAPVAGSSTDPAATPAAPIAAAEPATPDDRPASPPAQRRSTQAARGTSPPPVPAPEAKPELTPQERVMQVRTNCWMEVDRQRALRGIDARVDWVDKCIADRTKAQAR